MALRVASLDYLGVVAARLRKDAVQSQLKVDHIDQIIREIKAEESKDEDGSSKTSKKVITRPFYTLPILVVYLDLVCILISNFDLPGKGSHS